jgi:hypothetical protein
MLWKLFVVCCLLIVVPFGYAGFDKLNHLVSTSWRIDGATVAELVEALVHFILQAVPVGSFKFLKERRE